MVIFFNNSFHIHISIYLIVPGPFHNCYSYNDLNVDVKGKTRLVIR